MNWFYWFVTIAMTVGVVTFIVTQWAEAKRLNLRALYFGCSAVMIAAIVRAWEVILRAI